MNDTSTLLPTINPAKTHVALLVGGLSAEREVSISSGKGVQAALEALGYKVTVIDVDTNITNQLLACKPDIVFNALHGNFGEDGCIQGLLELLQIPYTHSGLLASALAMNKEKTKAFLSCYDIAFPESITVSRDAILDAFAQGKELMTRPYVIKPVQEGSSVGVYIVTDDVELTLSEDNLPDYHYACASDKSEAHNTPNTYLAYMIERYIPGCELSVAVIGEGEASQALGVIELKPKSGFYDYSNKYEDGKTEHIMPADIPETVYEKCMEISIQAHRLIGCRGVTRTDIRYDDINSDTSDGLYMLEINTLPGLTPLSLVPEIAQHSGISFEALIDRLIRTARCGN